MQTEHKRSKPVFFSWAGSALLGLASATAMAAPEAGSWHLNPGIGVQKYDSDRDLKNATLLGLGLEYGLSEQFSAELSYWRGQSDRERLFLTIAPWELTFEEIRLDGLYHFNNFSSGRITPYLAAGLGYERYDNGSRDVWEDVRVNAGPGMAMQLNERWRLLADARAAYGLDDHRLDLLGRLAVSFNLNGQAAQASQLTAAAPQPEPTPANLTEPEAEPQPVTPAVQTLVIQQEISEEALLYFQVMGAQLNPQDIAQLQEVADFMQEFPASRANIAGHTDNTGSAALNLRLSERRARAAANFLMAQDITADRLDISFHGYSQPVATNATSAGRALNRRTEVTAWVIQDVEVEVERVEEDAE